MAAAMGTSEDNIEGNYSVMGDLNNSPTDRRNTSKELLDVKGHSVPSILLKQNPDVPPCMRKTFRPAPSSILSQVQAFLPKMAAADAVLKQTMQYNPEEVNIENVDKIDGPVIEMNLGIVEQFESSDSSSDDETNNECDDNIDINFGEVTQENFKINNDKIKNRPVIEELKDSNTLSESKETAPEER